MKLLWITTYRVCYYAGIQTLRLCHRTRRFFAFLIEPLLLWLRRTAGEWIRRAVHRIKWWKTCFQGAVSRAFQHIRAAWKRHPLLGILQVFCIPFLAVRRYRRMAGNIVRIGSAFAAAAVLISTVQYWKNITYAVALERNGSICGYVATETVLQEGLSLAQERIGNINLLQNADIQPAMTLSVAHEDALLNKHEVCDMLLQESPLELEQACGLYVDGVLQGVLSSRRSMDAMLENILQNSRKGNEEVTASFLQEVTLVEGLYPKTSLTDITALQDLLTSEPIAKQYHEIKEGDTVASVAKQYGVSMGQLWQLNPSLPFYLTAGETILVQDSKPHLQVLVTGTIQYEVEIPFSTQRIADNSKYTGYEQVRVQGANGLSRITASATYLDGQLLYSEILSSETVKAPTNKIVAYGTKKVTKKTYSGGPYAVGKFIWPLKRATHITQHFGNNGHGGLDISDGQINGEDIIAADGGVVLVAAWRKGTSYASYGYYVLIDHGGGYKTLYAHCSKLLVKPGDIVKQGQVIATVGNTGRSTGPHLHFEIQINGTRANPMSYF